MRRVQDRIPRRIRGQMQFGWFTLFTVLWIRRERRKARFNEMERQVEDLTKQVKSLEAVEAQNVILSRRNVYLEKMVKIQSEEIANLKREAALQADELGHSGGLNCLDVLAFHAALRRIWGLAVVVGGYWPLSHQLSAPRGCELESCLL